MEGIDLEALPENVRQLILQQEEKLAKVNELLAQRAPYSNERFWKHGLNKLKFYHRDSSGSSSYASTYTAVDRYEVRHTGIFDDIAIHQPSWASEFLLALQTREKNKYMPEYISGGYIEDYIGRTIRDVMTCMGIASDLWIHCRTTLLPVVVKAGWRVLKSDFWVVRTKSDVPIAVIEVKYPGKSKLPDTRLLGQMFDYISYLRNSFGQCEIFGIVTTLEAWQVVWLPDTDDFAASKDLNPPIYEDLHTQFPVESTLARQLHGSAVYRYDDSQLLPLIGTVLLKSMHSQYREVSLLSSRRAYIILYEDNWRWGTISNTELIEHTAIALTLPNYAPNQLTVLRQFHGGADGQVCLALTKDFNLVVVKSFFNESLCEKEWDIWRKVYGERVLSTRLLDSQCLIMPFVFHCIEREGSVCFDFDLSNWGRVANSESLNDERFEAWTTKINNCIMSSGITAEWALNASVEKLARHSLVHGDLEWRHVALLPVLNDNADDVIGMNPVLIDLARVEKVESESIALERMQKSKADLMSKLT